jgi:hypothetical protein
VFTRGRATRQGGILDDEEEHGRRAGGRRGLRGPGRRKYAVKGRKVTFKSGPFHDFSGKFGHDQKGKPIITLTLKSDSDIKETCSHASH